MMDISKALEILGLSSNPSLEEVKKAYREQVKLWHPDRYSNGSTIGQMAAKNIQDANLAYAFLKRHLPTIPKNVSPRPPTTVHNTQTSSRSQSATQLIDRSIQLLVSLSQCFPKIPLRPVLKWLQDDARNHYRPWYRYPSSSEAGQKRREHVSFDQALRKAMGNRAQVKHHRRHRTSPHEMREGTVTPIRGVSKPVKPNRT